MRVEVLPNADEVARRAAEVIAEEAEVAVAARGLFLLATSGGTTPWRMLRILADETVPWERVHLFQVDERVAPAGHSARNLTRLRESLLAHVALPQGQLHPMPVEDGDLDAAAASYAATLQATAGRPPVLDLVHLGLGADGHTASLVPGDGALDVNGVDVAVTSAHAGYQRMTLTLPMFDRARAVLWVVTGADKAEALARLRRGDRSIPAGRVRSDRALLLADAAAAGVQPRR